MDAPRTVSTFSGGGDWVCAAVVDGAGHHEAGVACAAIVVIAHTDT
ncbi:hypothetical protein V2E29_11695 [Streptomyces diastatochromogenes]